MHDNASYRGRGDFVSHTLLVLLVTAALGGLTVLSLLEPRSVVLTHSLLLNVSITTAAIIVALAAAYFALTEFLFDGAVISLFIGIAFLLLAASNVGTGLLPVVASWTAGLGSAQDGWAAQQSVAAALLVGAALMRDREVDRGGRGRLILLGVLGATALAAIVAAWIYHLGSVQPPPAVDHSLQIFSAALFFAAGTVLWRAAKESRRTWFVWLALNFGVGGFVQLQYAIRPYSASVVQVGDVLRLVFFAMVLLGLVAEWGRGYRTLRTQTRELSVLHALMAAPSIEQPAAVLLHCTTIIGAALQADARILLTDQTTDALDPMLAHAVTLSTHHGGRQVIAFNAGPGLDQGLAVSLEAGGKHMGTLVATRNHDEPFTEYDVSLLEAFAAQTSVLLERSLLYEEVAAGAIVAERSRLAREIHDGLAQHLAFLKMRVAWLQRAPTSVDARQLRDIEGMLATALAEARQAITTLRTGVGGTSTVEAIQTYAQEFGEASGLSVTIRREDDAPEVGPLARGEVLRVVQEALNNVRKHAEAGSVEVEMSRQNHGLQVEVVDDGVGFNLREAHDGHFGLEIMQERAETIGGTIEIRSDVGQGTSVCVWVPMSDETEPAQLTG